MKLNKQQNKVYQQAYERYRKYCQQNKLATARENEAYTEALKKARWIALATHTGNFGHSNENKTLN